MQTPESLAETFSVFSRWCRFHPLPHVAGGIPRDAAVPGAEGAGGRGGPRRSAGGGAGPRRWAELTEGRLVTEAWECAEPSQGIPASPGAGGPYEQLLQQAIFSLAPVGCGRTSFRCVRVAHTHTCTQTCKHARAHTGAHNETAFATNTHMCAHTGTNNTSTGLQKQNTRI